MTVAGASYSINHNRIRRGLYPGFELKEDGTLILDPREGIHMLYLRAIDAGEEKASWGRLRFQVSCSEDMVYYLYAAAFDQDSFYRRQQPVPIEDFLCDAQESRAIKRQFLQEAGFARYTSQKDILLYELQGRYLYLVLEVQGEGQFSMRAMRVDRPTGSGAASSTAICQYSPVSMRISRRRSRSFQGSWTWIPVLRSCSRCTPPGWGWRWGTISWRSRCCGRW